VVRRAEWKEKWKVTDVLRKRLVVVLLAVALVAALGTASCAKKATTTPSTRPSAGTPTAPSTAAQAPTPGNIPAHLNADQLKKIDASKRDFSFAAFGDNRGSTTVFDTLISRVNADDVLFGLDNGDLVDSATVDNYRKFMAQWNAATRPMLTSGGNHDDPGGIYAALFGAPYYDFTVGGTLFLVLDDSNGNAIAGQQLEWMKGKLAAGQSYRNRIVFMHVPLFDPRYGPEGKGHSLADTANAQMLSALFDQYHVSLLVASHVHGYYEGTWGTTPYIISGGAGAPLYGTDPAHFFYHYVRVHVSDQGVTHEVVKI
jgi:hypothetical protein